MAPGVQAPLIITDCQRPGSQQLTPPGFFGFSGKPVQNIGNYRTYSICTALKRTLTPVCNLVSSWRFFITFSFYFFSFPDLSLTDFPLLTFPLHLFPSLLFHFRSLFMTFPILTRSLLDPSPLYDFFPANFPFLIFPFLTLSLLPDLSSL